MITFREYVLGRGMLLSEDLGEFIGKGLALVPGMALGVVGGLVGAVPRSLWSVLSGMGGELFDGSMKSVREVLRGEFGKALRSGSLGILKSVLGLAKGIGFGLGDLMLGMGGGMAAMYNAIIHDEKPVNW